MLILWPLSIVNLNFTTTLTFAIRTDVPNPEEALAAAQVIDEYLTSAYVEGFVKLAEPSDVFGL